MVIEVLKFDGKNGVELRCKEIEDKCLVFELEIRKKKMDFEGVKVRIRALEEEKVGIKKEIEGLKNKKREVAFEGAVVDELSSGGGFPLKDWKMDGDEVSKIDQLMLENRVLECEKSSAIREAEIWKQKCKELESRVLKLEGRLSCHGTEKGNDDDVHVSRDFGSSLRSSGARLGEIEREVMLGTPCTRSPDNTRTTRVQPGINAKRQLVFRKESSCDRKIAPSTPVGARSSSCIFIDIVDSDDEGDIPKKPGIILHSKGTPFIGTPKRKRKFKIEYSDSDGEDDDDIRPIKQVFNSGNTEKESNDDDDDNIPISQLVRNRAPRPDNADSRTRTRRRRRLVKSQQGENSPGNLAVENVELEDDNSEEDGSDSDAGSLSSFIVDDDDDDMEDDVDDDDGTDDPCKPEDSSDDNLDYGKIISRLQSRRDPNSKWDLEGEMLSDFGKDPELCMRAVCALYHQQTSTEKSCKESLVQNGLGFSKFDAPRGTELGEFLTDGDQNGDLVKSKEELQERDPNGLEKCCTFAKRYSKQLFEIYKNEEDPFFP